MYLLVIVLKKTSKSGPDARMFLILTTLLVTLSGRKFVDKLMRYIRNCLPKIETRCSYAIVLWKKNVYKSKRHRSLFKCKRVTWLTRQHQQITPASSLDSSQGTFNVCTYYNNVVFFNAFEILDLFLFVLIRKKGGKATTPIRERSNMISHFFGGFSPPPFSYFLTLWPTHLPPLWSHTFDAIK